MPYRLANLLPDCLFGEFDANLCEASDHAALLQDQLADQRAYLQSLLVPGAAFLMLFLMCCFGCCCCLSCCVMTSQKGIFGRMLTMRYAAPTQAADPSTTQLRQKTIKAARRVGRGLFAGVKAGYNAATATTPPIGRVATPHVSVTTEEQENDYHFVNDHTSRRDNWGGNVTPIVATTTTDSFTV